MAYTTDAALLQDIRDAIQGIVSGRVQSYRIGDRNFTYVDLSELRALEADVNARVSASADGGLAVASLHRPR